MRSIKQGKTSYISIKARDSGSPIGVTMISQTPRVTEIEATSKPLLMNGKAITDMPPGKGYQLCSLCGYRPENRFSRNAARKTGFDNYCKDCRKKIRSTKLHHLGINNNLP